MIANKNKLFLNKWGFEFVLFLLVSLIFAPIIYKMIFDYPKTDYNFHIKWAELMLHATSTNAVALFYWKDALKDNRIQPGWATLGLGAFYAYFLAETGSRFYDGNFTWSCEVAMVVMFCISTIFFVEKVKESRLKKGIVGLVWVAHLLCGIAYYLHIMLTSSYS